MFLVILIQFRFLLCECICTYLMEKDCVKCLRSTNSLPGYCDTKQERLTIILHAGC